MKAGESRKQELIRIQRKKTKFIDRLSLALFKKTSASLPNIPSTEQH